MSLREEIYGDYLQQIRDHYQENRQAAEAMREELNRSPLISRGRLIDMPLACLKNLYYLLEIVPLLLF